MAAFLPERCAAMRSLKNVDIKFVPRGWPDNAELLDQVRLYMRMLDLFPYAKDSVTRNCKEFVGSQRFSHWGQPISTTRR